MHSSNFLLVLDTYYFRLQISISGCSFLQSIDKLLELDRRAAR